MTFSLLSHRFALLFLIKKDEKTKNDEKILFSKSQIYIVIQSYQYDYMMLFKKKKDQTKKKDSVIALNPIYYDSMEIPHKQQTENKQINIILFYSTLRDYTVYYNKRGKSKNNNNIKRGGRENK